jgi:DNA-binding transcriptional LysR family regulator
MTLHGLQLFVSIAKEGSITKVSKTLRVSQPSVSQQLKRLQDEFGVALFTKNKRGLELTEHGKVILGDVESITAQVDALKAKYSGKNTAQGTRSLTIGGSQGPATSFLPLLLTLFKRSWPSAGIELKVCNSPDMQDLVVNSQVDLAVITNPVPTPSLEMEPFKEFQLCFFVAAHHPLAATEEVSPETLDKYPFIIGRGKAARSRTDELLSSVRSKGLKLNVLMHCEWPDAVREGVKQSEAIGILYRDLVEQGVREGVFKILNVAGLNLSVISYIVYSREKCLSQTAQEFLGFLRAARQQSGRSALLFQSSPQRPGRRRPSRVASR